MVLVRDDVPGEQTITSGGGGGGGGSGGGGGFWKCYCTPCWLRTARRI